MRFLKLLLTFCCISIYSIAFGNKAVDARLDFYDNKLSDGNLTPSESFACLDSIIKLQPNNKDARLKKMNMAFEIGNHRVAMKTALDIRRDTLDGLSESDMMLVNFRIASGRMFTEDYSGALEDALSLLRVQKNDSLRYYDIQTFLLLFDIYRGLRMFPMSFHYLESAENMLDKTNIPDDKSDRVLASFYLAKSAKEIHDSNYEAAFDYIKKVRQSCRYPNFQMACDANSAIIYEHLGESGMARDFYEKVRKSPVEHVNKLLSMYNYARFLMRNGELDKAIEYSEANLKLADHLGAYAEKELIYGGLSEIYEQKSDYKKAYENLVNANIIADSVFSAKYQNQIAEITQKNATYNLLDANRKMQTSYQNGVLICCGFALLLIGLIIVLLLMRHRLKKMTLANKSMKEECVSLQDKLEYIRNENSLNMEEANRQLSSLSLQILSSSGQRRQLESILNNKMMADTDKLKEIKKQVKDLNTQEKMFETFRNYFDKIHNGFLTALGKLHPNLTPGETQICAFIILNLSTREIAEMTNRSPRTIETIKYNIGKKLSVKEGDTVRNYLLSIVK